MLEFMFFIATGAILLFAAHELRMLWGFWSKGLSNKKRTRTAAAAELRHAPTVLVQLPVYNEPEVVAPLIKAVSGLDYPAERLSVQILDDSTDSTTQRIQAALAALDPDARARFHHIRRFNRAGFKAGALEHGLSKDSSEFVAIFDADFLPPADFLRRALIEGTAFDDADVAFLQGRWTHYNGDANSLARVQSVLIDRHFLVQKPFQMANGDDVTFNGSGGIWRRSAINAAGGWKSRTLCEDLDLSYRSALIGKTGRYDADLVCPNEIPASIEAFKQQQRRWAKGTAQCIAALFPQILKLGGVERRLNNAFAISGYLIHPVLLFYTLSWPLLVLGGTTDLTVLWICQLALVLGNIAAIGAFATTYYVRNDGSGTVRAARDVLLSTALGISLMVNNTVAFLSGVFGSRGVFERTPKTGWSARAAHLPEESAAPKLNWIVFAEAVFACYALTASLLMVQAGYVLEAQQTFLFGVLMLGLVGLQLVPSMQFISNRLFKLKDGRTVV